MENKMLLRLRQLLLNQAVISLIAIVLVFVLPIPSVEAISFQQKKVYKSGINYFDAEVANAGCDATNGAPIANTLPATIPADYAKLFNQAAAAYKINPQFIAALFLDEHSNEWLPFSGPWSNSSVATGPFQFTAPTWQAYGVDGNNDGTKDINNIYDAAFAAANYASKNGVTTTTPLGSIDKPFVKGTFLYFAASYNWGAGNVQQKTNPDSPLSAAPKETENYLLNTYILITSGFTKGSPGNGTPVDNSKGQTASVPGTSLAAGNSCSAGVVAGSIVQTALNLAWDTNGHGVNQADAKPSYQTAMPQYNGATSDTPYSDCGVFVSTVMIASGADPQYVKRSTPSQLIYLSSSSKYSLITATSTSDLQPGDIFVSSNHTYLYVGPQPKGYSAVAASLGDHVPQAAGNPYFTDSKGEGFKIFRLKGVTGV